MKNKLFEYKAVDKEIYEKELSSFLPDNIVDIHTHVWLEKYKAKIQKEYSRVVNWPYLVAKDNSIEDLLATYAIMFPNKKVTPLIFSNFTLEDDYESMNLYTSNCTAKKGIPSLLYSLPQWSSETFLEKIKFGKHLGAKVYLNLSPSYIPSSEIRIFDFIPPHHLEVLNEYGLILMLHIPRDKRLSDPVNLAQMLEIEQKYPNINVIYAHIGRAYCENDFGTAFEVLKDTKKLTFDFSATTNDEAIYRVLDTFGQDRLFFGSDLPILRMRMRRICENGHYINIVPKGLYGDVSSDKNMREVEKEESEKLTFFMYEELLAAKRAINRFGGTKEDINKIFYENGKNLILNVEKEFFGKNSLFNF